jgi:hypothetical protein
MHQRLQPLMRPLAVATAGLSLLIADGRPSAQTPATPGAPSSGMLEQGNEELSPRLVEGPDGQVYRFWQRAGDERVGGGVVLVARATAPDAWQTVFEMSSPEKGVNIREPDLVAGPAKELLVAYRWRRHNPRSKQVRLARSEDGGKAWSTPATSVDGSGQGFDPQLARGRGKTTVLVWSDERRGNRAFDIYARRSTDGGVTWEPEQHLSRFSRQIPSDIYARPRLVSDGADRFWTVWVGVRSGRSALYVNRSVDGGKTWTEPLAVSGDSRSVFGQTLAVAGNRLFLLWVDARTGHDRVYAASSSDAGANWTEPVAVQHLPDGSEIDATGQTALLLPGGEAIVAWSDSRNGRPDVFVNQSRDGGRSWASADVRIDMDEAGTAVSRFPRLAHAADGRVAVAWEDDRTGYEGIFLRVRSAGDKPEWGPETRLTPVTPKQGARLPQLLWAKDGILYVAWEVWDFSQGSTRVARRVDSRGIKLAP